MLCDSALETSEGHIKEGQMGLLILREKEYGIAEWQKKPNLYSSSAAFLLCDFFD